MPYILGANFQWPKNNRIFCTLSGLLPQYQVVYGWSFVFRFLIIVKQYDWLWSCYEIVQVSCVFGHQMPLVSIFSQYFSIFCDAHTSLAWVHNDPTKTKFKYYFVSFSLLFNCHYTGMYTVHYTYVVIHECIIWNFVLFTFFSTFIMWLFPILFTCFVFTHI